MDPSTHQLATEAIAVEGAETYLGKYAETFGPAELAAFLDANPTRWEPAGEDYGWECHANATEIEAWFDQRYIRPVELD